MRALIVIALSAAASLSAAESLTTKAGKVIAYDTIELDPKTPGTAFLLRSGSSIVTLKLSEVDAAVLPPVQKEQLEGFITKQHESGLILLDDEWINRDEHLLKLDKRFSYEKKLHRGAKNVIKVVNPKKERVTLGLRGVGKMPGDGQGIDGHGLEFSVEPLKTKTLTGIPDGQYYFYFVFETEDDSKLEVAKTSMVKLANTEYTLTMAMAKDGNLQVDDAGTIDIPQEMRFGK